jgi:uncharacterized membrane protein
MVINLPHALLFIIAVVGISKTSYLIHKRIAGEKPVCPIGQGCASVLSSKYNQLFFHIHNDVLGLLFFIVFAVMAMLMMIGAGPQWLWEITARTLLVGATLISFFLIYLQAVVLKEWCFWCLMSSLTVGLMDIIVFLFV